MKLNKKGFMMAEVIITSSVVAVILVTLYIGINRMNNAYDKRNRYYDLDAQQVAMEVNDLEIAGGDYGADQHEIEDLENLVKTLGYDDIKIRFVEYNLDKLKSLSSELSQDYIDYLLDKLDFTANYDYMVIVQLQKQDDYYYYTLKVKE